VGAPKATAERSGRRRFSRGLGRTAKPPRSAEAAGLLASTTVRRPEVASERERRYRRLLGAADVIAVAGAFWICVERLGDGDHLTPFALLALPLMVLVSKISGLYDRDELLLNRTTLDEAPALFELATLTAFLLWLGDSLFIIGELGRGQALALWGVLFLLLLTCRAAARAAARQIAPTERVLLMGAPRSLDRVQSKMELGERVDAEVAGRIDFSTARDAVEAAQTARRLASELNVQRLVLAPPNDDHGEVLEVLRAANAQGLKVSLVPRMLEVMGSSVEFEDLDGLSLLGVRQPGLTSSSMLVKRGLDLSLSLLALLLLAPLMALIAIAVKLGSRGPVLFRQQRIGRGGLPFWMLKFRTMVDGADRLKADLMGLNEADGLFKIADDPRMTRVGRWLRRLSLDELPQLINVVRGEMSLVGPRPLVVEDDRRVEGRYRRRLQLTPGLTGRWQVLGSARLPLHEMVKLDYLYFANWSLWGDVKILLRTVLFVVGRRGL
jgi:exopolysaccharide biosynthesis polyprenyl glycosylphosphotransferase